MREILNLPTEEIAEIMANNRYGDEHVKIGDLDCMYLDEDPVAKYCLDYHEECNFLDSCYDSECPHFMDIAV